MENLGKNIKEGEFNKPEISQEKGEKETIKDLQKKLVDLNKKEREIVAGLPENEPGTSYYSQRNLDFIREEKRKIQEKINNLRKKETIQ